MISWITKYNIPINGYLVLLYSLRHQHDYFRVKILLYWLKYVFIQNYLFQHEFTRAQDFLDQSERVQEQPFIVHYKYFHVRRQLVKYNSFNGQHFFAQLEYVFL